MKIDEKTLESWILELELLNKNWFDKEIEEFKNFTQFDIKQIPLYQEDDINNLPIQIKYYITQPPIFKLLYQKQLSYLDLFYLGGGHTRLEHIIGTVTIGNIILNRLKEKEILKLDDCEEIAFLTSLLIHDCGQPPFGHSLEILKSLFIEKSTKSYEKIDKRILRNYLENEDNNLVKTLLKPWENRDKKKIEFKKKFFNLLKNLFDYEIFIKENSHNCIIYQLLNSNFDCDRLDWIRRDQMHLEGKETITETNIYRLFNNLRLLTYPEDNDKENRIGFSENDINILNDIFLKRKYLYDRYYHGDLCRIFDTVFPNLIFRFLYYYDLIIHDLESPVSSKLKNQFFENLLKLPDNEFLNFIYNKDRSWYIHYSLRELFIGNYPYIMKKWQILRDIEKTNEEIDKIQERLKIDLSHFEDDIEMRQKFKKHLKEVYSGDEIPLNVCFYFLCNKNSKDSTTIFKIQLQFWKKLIESNKEIESTIDHYIFNGFSSKTENILKY